MMLAYLLGRAGVDVTLLEAHRDFDRDFRGDSLHPYTLELLDQLGLADGLLTLPHYAARQFRFHTPTGTITVADYGRIDSRYNYIALMPQARFLDYLAKAARALPTCTVTTGAKVTGLVHDDTGRVCGVRYREPTGAERELSASLVVGTDGRFSRVRRLADLTAHGLGTTSDLLWFRLPRHDSDPPEADLDLYFGRHHYVGLLGGLRTWQVGYTLPKGGYTAARKAGVRPIRNFVTTHVPWLADRIELLTDFGQTTLLSVEISRVESWHRPGLLLLGDAAHVISPVGGNGILMAIQDAVAAANVLVPALRSGPVGDGALAEVQARREPAIKRVQDDQARIERRIANAREAGRVLAPPTRLLRVVTRLPGVRGRTARANAYGPQPPRLEPGLFSGLSA
jgi:2-polyprenyl-6-methoxyphenol hydroxylase-like FAD-dependent oxidoreductase